MLSKEECVFNYFRNNPSKIFEKSYTFAEKIHRKHKRKDGSPYIVHPLEINYTLLILNITDEVCHGSGICHDAKEEARDKDGIVISKKEIAEAVNLKVAGDVVALTKEQGLGPRELILYFQGIEKEPRRVLLKMVDRYANIRRSMFGVFDSLQIGKYVYETNYYILPMSERIITLAESWHDFSGKDEYVKYANALRILRGAIRGILRGAEHSVQLSRRAEKCDFLEAENAILKERLKKKED